MKPEIQTLKPMTVGTCACGEGNDLSDRIDRRQGEPFMPVMPSWDDLAAAVVQPLLEDWLRLCAGHRELLANYDRLRGTNLSGRGTPIDRLIDEATGKLEAEAQAFFDWCVEMFERLDWKELI